MNRCRFVVVENAFLVVITLKKEELKTLKNRMQRSTKDITDEASNQEH